MLSHITFVIVWEADLNCRRQVSLTSSVSVSSLGRRIFKYGSFQVVCGEADSNTILTDFLQEMLDTSICFRIQGHFRNYLLFNILFSIEM